MKKSRNDNKMPERVYIDMMRWYPAVTSGISNTKFDLHHCLVDKHLVMKMPLSERIKIHDVRNLWWERSDDHASHANIRTKHEYYNLLCARFGEDAVDAFVNSFHWKSNPPVTVEWLESEE